MRTLRVAFLFVLFAIPSLLVADDQSALIASCGHDVSIETHRPSEYNDGLWHRTLEYRSGDEATDWAVVGFTSHSRGGPWKYEDSFNASKLSCLTASGIVPQQPIAISTTPVSQNSSADSGNIAVGIVILLLILIIYFIPLAVALERNCKATGGIAVVNVLLGWTLIGWVIALAWAAAGEKKLKVDPARALTPEEEQLAMILLARMQANKPPHNLISAE